MLDLSIIIPVYNVEKYLKRCLDSILLQITEGKFEVIAVNDGSDDDSLKILEEYSEKYKNLKIINQNSNKSLAVARRTGIENSEGDYIIHVDSDDWINANMFNDLLKLAKKQNFPDVIVYNYTQHNGLKVLNTDVKIKEFKSLGQIDKNTVQHLFFGTCVNKMVKRNILNDLIYGLEYQNTTEDLIYGTEVFIKASRIELTPSIYYNYFVNTQSLTSTITSEKYLKAQILVYKLLQSIKEKYEVKEEWFEQIGIYLDQWILEQIFTHHFSKNKIDNITFADFKIYYKSFNIYYDKLDIEVLYNDKLYCLKKTAKRIGWIKTIKRTII